jgi:hypothetical protein
MGLFDFLNPFRQEKPNPLVHPPSKPPVPADARRELLALQSKVGLLEEKLKLAEVRFLQLVNENNHQKSDYEAKLAQSSAEKNHLASRLQSAHEELASLGKFASVKSDSRKVIYGVSQELRKKWLSVDESVDRHQVVGLLGQPSMILISEDFDLRQAVQGGLHGADDAAAEKIVGQLDRVLARTRCFDTKFLEQGRLRVLSVWVYANDSFEPGFVIFASEADGGAMVRCFPPEC